MSRKTIKEVKVVVKFPGYELGDVLIKNSENGLFEYAYNVNDTSNVSNVFKAIAVNKPTLSLKDIQDNITYFEDITGYKVKTPEELEKKMVELYSYIKNIKEDDKSGLFAGSVTKPDVKEAVTVWQNMIWLLEWALGKREDI